MMPSAPAALNSLDAVAFIAEAAGRDPLTPAEQARADRLGVTWLALG
jgi:hypothetical protein